MPVHKVPNGWQWGKSGKVYKQKWKAERQGRAIYFAKQGRKRKEKG